MFLKRLSNKVSAPFQLFYWRIATPETEGAKVLIEHEGRYLLLREKYGQKYWTLPGGRAKGDEPSEATARRKTKQEVGITLGEIISIGSYFHTRQGKKDVVSTYYGHVPTNAYRIDKNSVAEADWFTVEEIDVLDRSASVDDVLELYTKYRLEK